MSERVRLLAVMTHPVQYFSPLFAYIHRHAADVALEVVYAVDPTPAQQGVGFGTAIDWNVPLKDGYPCTVLRQAGAATSLSSAHFFGVDTPEISEFIRRRQPDVALVTGWHSAFQVRAIATLRRLRTPILYRGDSHLGSIHPRWPRLSRARARFMLQQFSGYLAVGTRSREYLRAMGVPDPAIVASPHAIDVDAFRVRSSIARPRRIALRRAYGFSDDQQVLLFAGKLAAGKRPADVIAAAARLERGAVLFAGDGEERAALQALASARGVHAVFAGFVDQTRMPDAYVAADALVLPGRETWGLVVNEALACGLPVVASSQVGSVVDFETPGVCVRVEAGDIEGIVRGVDAVVAARRQDGRHVERCSDAVARFTFAEAARGLVTAATLAVRNRRPAATSAPARVIALAGNLVFAGGMERITFEGLSALRSAGADVHALVNDWSSRPIAELAEGADVTWQVGHYGARLDGVFRHPLRLLRALGDVTLASLQLTQLMVRRRATHVFAADFRAVLVHAPALLACRMSGIDVILRSGVAPTATPLHRWLWRWVIRPLVSKHIANSRFTARELSAARIPAGQITIIANVAPRRRSTGAPRSRVAGRVAYVGQVIPEKGVLPLVDAVGLLVTRGVDVSLDIAGQMDGWAPATVHAYRRAIRERITAPDLVGRVRLLGWREDVEPVLQEASVHCCPSQPAQREGFGITVVEAKRAGIPSVVCPSGALPELIDHLRDGFVTEGFDAEAIADGLAWCLSDVRVLERLQDAARVSATTFDPAIFGRQWQETFGIVDHSRRRLTTDGAVGGWREVSR